MKNFKSIIFKSSCLITTILLVASFNVSATRFRNKMNKPKPYTALNVPSKIKNIGDESIISSEFFPDFITHKYDTRCIVDRKISSGNIIHINSYGTEFIVDKVIIDELGREYFFYKSGPEKQRFKDFINNLKSMKIKYEVKNSSEEYLLSLFGK